MTPVQSKSKAKIFMIVGGVLLGLLILCGAAYAIYQAAAPKAAPIPAATVAQPKSVPTSGELNSGLDKLDTTLQQETIDHQKAKDAMNDEAKRIKLN